MWPPTLPELKVDQSVEGARDDTRLQLVLDAAVAFVEGVHAEKYNFDADPESELPDPPKNFELGAMRLAYRWHIRRRSPDGLVSMAELGAARIPSFDPDIERLLKIGRYRGPVFA
jgi:hypothetical protein